jgi:phosphoribosylformylglycinamidine synthase I
MRVRDIKVCVMRIEGTNCEEEAYLAFKRLGANAEKVHLKQLLGKCPSELKRELSSYQILMIPGGFSAGDYVRAGAIWAARMKSGLSKELVKFVDSGKPVLGVCNGFQVLVELGLLPAFEGTLAEFPEAVLNTNDSSRFECRPTYLRHDNSGNCVFTGGLRKGEVVMCPSAHAEGKFMLPLDRQKKLLERLIDNDQIVFRYSGPEGKIKPGYPWNPNGSLDDIAGICNPQGNVFGLMPHPERVFTRYTHPDWTRSYPGPRGDGKAIFESVLEYSAGKF